MPIQLSELQTLAIYITKTDQLRRIDKIENGRVHYSTSGNNASHDWAGGPNKSNPPTIEKFCEDVASLYLAAPANE
jgi:hypothetical protein